MTMLIYGAIYCSHRASATRRYCITQKHVAIVEVGCMELFFQFVLATTFFDAFYDTGNSKKRIIKKYEKFRWCTQFSFGDFKIRHFSQIVIILVCKEHKFLIFLSQYMLKYVLNMSLDCCWHYKVIWLCSGGSL